MAFDIFVLKLCIKFTITIILVVNSERGFILWGEDVCESGKVLGRIGTGGPFFGESVDADYGFGGGVGCCPFG